jgi:Ca-activated chloride channel homolog
VRFSDPYWLVGGLVAGVVLIALWRWHDVQQQAALARFVAAHLRLKLTGSVSGVRRFVQRTLLLLAGLSLFSAIAGPQLGFRWEQISRRGNEVVFAIDTSRSMLTPDVKPDRLTRAKLAIDDMAGQLDGDGIGIVAFAGTAFLVCPLTLDYGAFHQSLDAIDAHTIARGGTNISSAILAARAALRRHPGGDRILILVTDGENLEGDALAAAKEASSEDGLKIYTVGVGTPEGDLIPVPGDEGNHEGRFVKDDAGNWVKSHLDEAGLKALASATGGTYVRLERQGEDFETFLRTVFSAVSKHDLRYRQQKIYIERYQWPLAGSLVMLLGSLMMGTRRGRRRVTVAVTATALGVMLLPMRSQSAAQQVTPRGEYNAGISAYRARQFSRSTQAFQESIKAAPASDARRLADQEDAYYNLGNALYRAGQQLEKSAPQAAIQKWTEAVKAYDTALQLQADDADSRHNRDLVQRKIDALQKPPNQGGGGDGSGGGQGGGGGKGPGQGQPPPQGSGQPRGQAPPKGQPPPPAQQAAVPPSNVEQQNAPAQMSAEEARGLLDSAKGDERHSLPAPAGPRDPQSPDKPYKNW